MSRLKKWHNQVIGTKAAAALEKKNFKAAYFETRQEAIEKILELIPPNASVGVAGSRTIRELGVDDILAGRGHAVYNVNKPGYTKEETLALRYQGLTADVLLSGSNAVTMEGELINVDGAGNRVAAMIFGPKKVIVAVGVNKIVKTRGEAFERIKQVASPLVNKMLSYKNPCAETGECMNCQGASRICNVTTIMHAKPTPTDIHIFIIGEELGL